MFDRAVANLCALRRLGAMLALAMVLGGCAVVVAIEPMVYDRDAEFDPTLVGTWELSLGSNGGKETIVHLVVSRAEERLYAIEVTDGSPQGESMKGRFKARLGRLGGRLVLDLWPSPRPQDRYADVLLIAGHVLLSLNLQSDELRVAGLDATPLLAALGDGKVRLNHDRSDGYLILHGTTEALRAALGPYVADAQAWVTSKKPICRVRRATDGAPPVQSGRCNG
jgi:hypothetical protein